MIYVTVISGILALWSGAYLVLQRVPVSRVWMAFDIGLGVAIAIYLAIDGRALEGLAVGFIIAPVLLLFSAFRTMQMRYFERKTETILGKPTASQKGDE